MMKALGYSAAILVVVALAASGCGGGGGGGSNVATVQYNGLPEDASRYYRSVVPPGTSRMTVVLSDMNTDGDLYVRNSRGLQCSSDYARALNEVCEFPNPASGNWEIEVETWGPGSLNFRLTVTLEPSDRVASLEFVRQETAVGSAAVQSEGGQVAVMDSGVTELPQQLELYLTAVKSILLQAHAHEIEGNVRISDASMEGKGQLSVVRADGNAEVDFRLKIRGNDQHSVLAQSTKPILLDPHSGVPREGAALLDAGAGGVVEVRFGSDTGTGADIQVIAEPGPVVRELGWAELTGHWQVELQTAGGISAGRAGLPD